MLLPFISDKLMYLDKHVKHDAITCNVNLQVRVNKRPNECLSLELGALVELTI